MDIQSKEFQIGVLLGIKLGKANATVPDILILETLNRNLEEKHKKHNYLEELKLLIDKNMANSQE